MGWTAAALVLTALGCTGAFCVFEPVCVSEQDYVEGFEQRAMCVAYFAQEKEEKRGKGQHTQHIKGRREKQVV